MFKGGELLRDSVTAIPTTEIRARFFSPKLLVFGSILGLLGVVFTITNTLLVYWGDRRNPVGVPYPSGYGYWPLTVSEAVSRADTAANQVFFAFCLLGGLSIFMSWYPFHLENVYTGNHMFPFTGIRWVTLRQMLPTPGLILLAIVPMTAKPLQHFTDKVALLLHGVGAAMTFVGYFLCEYHVLFVAKEQTWRDPLSNKQFVARLIPSIIFMLAFAVFGICYVLDKVNTNSEMICCPDDWKEVSTNFTLMVNGTSVQSTIKKKMLFDTARNGAFVIKVIGYLGEIVAFVMMMFNHIIIWFFCKERFDHSERVLSPLVENMEDDDEAVE